jgi:hypothetical protein
LARMDGRYAPKVNTDVAYHTGPNPHSTIHVTMCTFTGTKLMVACAWDRAFRCPHDRSLTIKHAGNAGRARGPVANTAAN